MLAVFVNVITVLLGSAVGLLFRNKINSIIGYSITY